MPTPTVCAPGTAITGFPFTVTAMFLVAAVPPKLSVAFSVIGSEPTVPSVSTRVPSAALTLASNPLTVSVVPGPLTVAPFALPIDSTPVESVRVTVNVSPACAPASDRLTPAMDAA